MIKVMKAGVASAEKRRIDTEIQSTVSNIIDQIEAEGDEALRRLIHNRLFEDDFARS